MVVALGWDHTDLSVEKSLAIYDGLLSPLRTMPGVAEASASLLTPYSAQVDLTSFTATHRRAGEQRTTLESREPPLQPGIDGWTFGSNASNCRRPARM